MEVELLPGRKKVIAVGQGRWSLDIENAHDPSLEVRSAFEVS